MIRFLNIVALFFAMPAFAFADGVSVLAPVGPTLIQTVIAQAVTFLMPLIMAAGLAALVKLSTYLHAKEGESAIAKVGAIVTDAAHGALEEIETTLEPKIKAALADGVITDAEKADIEKAALDLLKTKLPAGVLASAQSIFGPMLQSWLLAKVGSVADQRAVNQAAVAKLAPASVPSPLPA